MALSNARNACSHSSCNTAWRCRPACPPDCEWAWDSFRSLVTSVRFERAATNLAKASALSGVGMPVEWRKCRTVLVSDCTTLTDYLSATCLFAVFPDKKGLTAAYCVAYSVWRKLCAIEVWDSEL